MEFTVRSNYETETARQDIHNVFIICLIWFLLIDFHFFFGELISICIPTTMNWVEKEKKKNWVRILIEKLFKLNEKTQRVFEKLRCEGI